MPSSDPTLAQRCRRWWHLLWSACAVALICCFTVASAATAQDAESPGEVNTDEYDYVVIVNVKNDNEPVSGARIVVTDTAGYEAETTTNERGQARIGVPTTEAHEVLLDEESLPEGIIVDGQNPITVEYGSQFFQPANFFLGEGERQVTGFWTQFIERLMNGLNFGLMLALAAIGVSLIFGTTGLTNFAHAEMLTFGALMALLLSSGWGLPIALAIVLAVIASGLFGMAVNDGIWKPLRRRGVGLVQMMILTIGLSLALRYTFLFLNGGDTDQLGTPPLLSPVKRDILGPIRLSTLEMASMAISVVVLLSVAWWLLRTRTGKATRAVSDNPALAAASGIDVEKVTRIVWVAAGSLAGLSGILWAYFRPGIKWDMGAQVILLIFAAVCLGGLGTAFGALVGALAIGILVEVSTLWLPSDIKYVGALGVLVLMLLVRPQGLLGRRERVG